MLTSILLAALALLAVGGYLSWLAGRLDRLHTRVETAWASLDAQLVRRSAAAADLAEQASRAGLLDAGQEHALLAAARAASRAGRTHRADAENDLGRQLHVVVAALPADPRLSAPLADLTETCRRLVYARRFHNDAIRDTRTVRRQRVVRLFRLAGHAPTPGYFEIDDRVPGGP